jgi:hypothetical protein
MSKKYEILNNTQPKRSNSNQVLNDIDYLQNKFKPSVGPLSDPWQFRIYLQNLTIRKNDV